MRGYRKNYKGPSTGGPKPKDPRMLPTEGEEQATLFSWMRMQSRKHPELRLMFHIPNGGSRHTVEAARFKAEGVKAGVPDLFLPVARGIWHGLFIEMKRQKGGRVSEAQRRWLADLEREGYRAEIACGWKEAAEIILEYLEAHNVSISTVRPVAKAAWKRIDYKPCGHDYGCSSCGWKNDMATHFCPNCGAKMEES